MARPLARYVLLQVPGWVLAGCGVYWLWPRTGLEPWLGAVALAAWVAKDFALWPFLRIGYEPAPTGAGELVGLRGVVRKPLSPEGSVRVRGELWRAQVEGGDVSVSAGAEVEVVSASGMTLRVRPVATSA